MAASRSRRGGGEDLSKFNAQRLGETLSQFLRTSGIADRVKQMSVLEDWGELVGPEIAAVTKPLSISHDGTILVAVQTHAWMQELTLMERELLGSLNRVTGNRPLQQIRWVLRRS